MIEHRRIRVGRVPAPRAAALDPLAQDGGRRDEVDDDERHLQFAGERAKRVPLPSVEECAVDKRCRAAVDDVAGELPDAVVGPLRFVERVQSAVDWCSRPCDGVEAVQPFPFDIGADADGADVLEERA
jgi:hypothetical protein